MKTVKANELDHTHITNLISVDHPVTMTDRDGPDQMSVATTTGQLFAVTRTGTGTVILLIGGTQVPVDREKEVVVYSSLMGMHSDSITELMRTIAKEELNDKDAS